MCRPNLHPRRRVALLRRADFYRRGCRFAPSPRAYLRRFPLRLTALELGGQDLNLISRFDWYVTTLAGC